MSRIKIYFRISLYSIFAFIFIIIIAILLSSEHSAKETYLSEYAIGQKWFLGRLAFASLVLSSFTLLIALIKTSFNRKGKVGIVFFGIWTICALLAVVFPTDPQGMELTNHGIIHVASSMIGFTALVTGMLLLSYGFRDYKLYNGLNKPTQYLGIAILITIILISIYFVPESIPGIGQWILFGFLSLWVVIVSWTAIGKKSKS